MEERRGAAAWRYHELVKHTPESVRAAGWRLWGSRPDAFKEYAELEPLPLPRDPPEHGVSALEALAGQCSAPGRPVTLPELSRLLRLGAGVLRTRRVGRDGISHLRTYSSAGGLYPLEVYVAGPALAGLAAGLYHFDPRQLSLRRLREGDVRGALAELADAPVLGSAGVVIAITGILWRSAWRYGPRAYRHVYWDAGTMLANLLALTSSAGMEAHVATGFADAQLSELLAVDGAEEAPLVLLAVGCAAAAPAASELAGDSGRAVGPASVVGFTGELGAGRASQSPGFAAAMALHRASTLASVNDVRAWRQALTAAETAGGAPIAPRATLEPLSRDALEEVIRRRGSARAFSSEPVGVGELRAILARASAPLPIDVPQTTEIRLIANAIAGLKPGAYRFTNGQFELLGHGAFRGVAGYLCMEQAPAAHAAATNFLLADLPRVLERLGDRGYRAAHLEAGVRAGRIYLGAYAQCLGATALTFYDNDVTTFLAPGLSPILTVAVGVDARRRDLSHCRQALVAPRLTPP